MESALENLNVPLSLYQFLITTTDLSLEEGVATLHLEKLLFWGFSPPPP